MKGKTLTYIILLATISVAGVLSIQFFFLRNSYNYSEKQFRESTSVALREVAWQILLANGSTAVFDSITPVEIAANSYYYVNTDVFIDYDLLKFHLDEELKKHQIYTDFEFAIFNPSTKEMEQKTLVTAEGQERTSSYRFPEKANGNDYYFAVHFPDRAPYFHSRLSVWYLFTGLLVLVVVFFGYTLSVIIRQRQLSEIQKKSEIYIHTDIIGHLAKTGNWCLNLKEDFSIFESAISYANSFSINADLYQNAGANMVQQLAYAMAHTNEYFNHIENISKEQSAKHNVVYNIAIGTNYFFEIAKLRALRLLFETLNKVYNTNYNCHILATPSKRNKAIYDYNTNMLRTTTECMSAVLGGADTICNLPYDAIFHKHNNFSARIARNQLLILKHESYFNAVNNPSDGSYYIESLTEQLAEKALTLFKDIEANGGFLKQLKDGTIQRKIKESATKEEEQFTGGSEVILGSNKYPNTNDKMKENLDIYPFVKFEKRKTLIVPIIEKRLTENLEQKRLKKE